MRINKKEDLRRSYSRFCFASHVARLRKPAPFVPNPLRYTTVIAGHAWGSWKGSVLMRRCTWWCLSLRWLTFAVGNKQHERKLRTHLPVFESNYINTQSSNAGCSPWRWFKCKTICFEGNTGKFLVSSVSFARICFCIIITVISATRQITDSWCCTVGL